MIVVLAPLQGKTDADIEPNLKRSLDRLLLWVPPLWLSFRLTNITSNRTLADAQVRLQDLSKTTKSRIAGYLAYQGTAENLRACKESLKWAMQEFQVRIIIPSTRELA